MSRMKFMNTEIDNLTMQETLQAIDRLIQEDRSAYVVTPNVDHIVQLETSKELQAVYENASLILTDGKPLLWIAKWYGTPIKEKISGSDLFPLLCDMAAKKGYSTKELVLDAMFIALTYVFTAFLNVRLPIAANGLAGCRYIFSAIRF